MLKTAQKQEETEGITLGHKLISKCGSFIYHISIIDYLQKYNIHKKVERYYKIVFQNASPSELSTINCKDYAKRFLSFMSNQVFN